ncbi:MAG: class I SAM-dependent methyltransferase [Thermoleophilaceae bacterium]|nr:class I SAM-dependent methyltransferase [Thermoleophilaceae bacterium]
MNRHSARARLRHPRLRTRISPGDTMYRPGPAAYFPVGRSALHAIEEVLALAGSGGVNPILDLPCGHGRVLRWLRSRYPDAVITACDIDRPGVDFCARTFGAEPVYGSERFAETRLPRRYDLVWCGSLLTHLDLAAWREALSLLVDALRPGGVLIASTHGPTALENIRRRHPTRLWGLDQSGGDRLIRAFESGGFGYADYPKRAGYGISLATPSFVEAVLAELPGVDGGRVLERRWADHHDIAYCVKTSEVDTQAGGPLRESVRRPAAKPRRSAPR